MSEVKIPLRPGLDPRLDAWVQDHIQPPSKRIVDVDHVFTGVVNAQERVRHRLGHKPVGFRVIAQDRIGSVYSGEGTTPHDRTHLYLKSSVAGLTVRLEVF